MMRKWISLNALAVGFAVAAHPANAQQATERFIPIGQSPGLSASYNWIGEISAVDREAGTVTVRNEQGEQTVRITDTTDVWIDRTAMQQTNTIGSVADLVVGRRAEIRYTDYERKEVAAWIKVAGR